MKQKLWLLDYNCIYGALSDGCTKFITVDCRCKLQHKGRPSANGHLACKSSQNIMKKKLSETINYNDTVLWQPLALTLSFWVNFFALVLFCDWHSLVFYRSIFLTYFFVVCPSINIRPIWNTMVNKIEISQTEICWFPPK